jgi:putative transposase
LPALLCSALANDLQISGQTICVWRRQEAIDTGEPPGVTSTELAELSKARRRIAELEAGLAIHRRAPTCSRRRCP